MSSLRIENKKLVNDFTRSIRKATADNIGDILKKYYHDDACWNGSHPINDLNGLKEITEGFYKPLLSSFPNMQKNQYILFAGNYKDADWVVSSGNFVGNFKKDWLDIPHSGKSIWMRYMEFNKIIDGKIAETYLYMDILDVMRQVGIKFVPHLASEINIPGPATLDGVNLGESDQELTEKTFKLVDEFLYKALPELRGMEKTIYPEEATIDLMKKYWHDDTMWYGPCGIGTTRTIYDFLQGHEHTWELTFPHITGGRFQSYFAEGNYATLSGWPCAIGAKHGGSNLFGLAATNKVVDIRIADIYRLEDGLVAENWVFIDILDLLNQLGIDVFYRLKNNYYTLNL